MSRNSMKRNSSKPVAGDGVPALPEENPKDRLRVGVLSLQGDFETHGRVLRELGAEPIYVRNETQLEGLDGLIIPGGESTTILKLLRQEGLFDAFLKFAHERPILGTCAGSILLATEVLSPQQPSLGVVDMTLERNAYGRQVDSSIRHVEPSSEFTGRTAPGELEAVFIRAPIIRRVGEAVKVLARDEGVPVLVEQGRCLATTFHPELSTDHRVHQLFLDKIRSSK